MLHMSSVNGQMLDIIAIYRRNKFSGLVRQQGSSGAAESASAKLAGQPIKSPFFSIMCFAVYFQRSIIMCVHPLLCCTNVRHQNCDLLASYLNVISCFRVNNEFGVFL